MVFVVKTELNTKTSLLEKAPQADEAIRLAGAGVVVAVASAVFSLITRVSSAFLGPRSPLIGRVEQMKDSQVDRLFQEIGEALWAALLSLFQVSQSSLKEIQDGARFAKSLGTDPKGTLYPVKFTPEQQEALKKEAEEIAELRAELDDYIGLPRQ